VTSAEPDAREQTYNLVVADFHTYFVGKTRVLSHDNTPCPPSKHKQPGKKQRQSNSPG
jgi:hypothetical protein